MLADKAKEVLQVLQREGILEHLVLIGSWCCHFYVPFFGKKNYTPNIQTLDIDFLIPKPTPAGLKKSPRPMDELLKSLDFDTDFTASGWLRFVHPELRVEFLVPRVGAQPDEPQTIPGLEITAMPLRHSHVLTKHTIGIEEDGIHLRIPHPAAFALHKLFVSGRRKDAGKAARDKETAFRILEAILATEKTKDIHTVWDSFTAKEQRDILAIIRQEGPIDLISIFFNNPPTKEQAGKLVPVARGKRRGSPMTRS